VLKQVKQAEQSGKSHDTQMAQLRAKAPDVAHHATTPALIDPRLTSPVCRSC
jgi:hypothetical protein